MSDEPRPEVVAPVVQKKPGKPILKTTVANTDPIPEWTTVWMDPTRLPRSARKTDQPNIFAVPITQNKPPILLPTAPGMFHFPVSFSMPTELWEKFIESKLNPAKRMATFQQIIMSFILEEQAEIPSGGYYIEEVSVSPEDPDLMQIEYRNPQGEHYRTFHPVDVAVQRWLNTPTLIEVKRDQNGDVKDSVARGFQMQDSETPVTIQISENQPPLPSVKLVSEKYQQRWNEQEVKTNKSPQHKMRDLKIDGESFRKRGQDVRTLKAAKFNYAVSLLPQAMRVPCQQLKSEKYRTQVTEAILAAPSNVSAAFTLTQAMSIDSERFGKEGDDVERLVDIRFQLAMAVAQERAPEVHSALHQLQSIQYKRAVADAILVAAAAGRSIQNAVKNVKIGSHWAWPAKKRHADEKMLKAFAPLFLTPTKERFRPEVMVATIEPEDHIIRATSRPFVVTTLPNQTLREDQHHTAKRKKGLSDNWPEEPAVQAETIPLLLAQATELAQKGDLLAKALRAVIKLERDRPWLFTRLEVLRNKIYFHQPYLQENDPRIRAFLEENEADLQAIYPRLAQVLHPDISQPVQSAASSSTAMVMASLPTSTPVAAPMTQAVHRTLEPVKSEVQLLYGQVSSLQGDMLAAMMFHLLQKFPRDFRVIAFAKEISQALPLNNNDVRIKHFLLENRSFLEDTFPVFYVWLDAKQQLGKERENSDRYKGLQSICQNCEQRLALYMNEQMRVQTKNIIDGMRAQLKQLGVLPDPTTEQASVHAAGMYGAQNASHVVSHPDTSAPTVGV